MDWIEVVERVFTVGANRWQPLATVGGNGKNAVVDRDAMKSNVQRHLFPVGRAFWA